VGEQGEHPDGGADERDDADDQPGDGQRAQVPARPALAAGRRPGPGRRPFRGLKLLRGLKVLRGRRPLRGLKLARIRRVLRRRARARGLRGGPPVQAGNRSHPPSIVSASPASILPSSRKTTHRCKRCHIQVPRRGKRKPAAARATLAPCG